MRKWATVLSFGLVGWAFCGLVMGVGPGFMPMSTLLIVHAIAAPLFIGLLSLVYHAKFGYTAPAQTATVFVSLIIILDAGLVAPVFQGSFEMFRSFLGTWLVFMLIFLATYVAGRLARRTGIAQ